MTKEAVLMDAQKLVAVGADEEMILLFLRDHGFNKIASINAVRALLGKSTQEAKSLVDGSNAWSDHFYSDLELRDKARQALSELASSGDKSLPKVELVGLNEAED